MNSSEQRLTELFDRWYNYHASEVETREMIGLLRKNDEENHLEELMKEAYEKSGEERFFTIEQKNRMADFIMGIKPAHARIFTLRRVAAAAVIIILLGTGAYFMSNRGSYNQREIVKKALPKDVKAPQSSKAMITLANGKQIILDSVGNGTVAKEGDVNVIKLADGQIAYNEASGSSISGEAEVGYNTLSNPRGSRVVSLTLADGTKVWLNAASSLTYPTAFSGKERKVEITGEAYFEVTHNTAMPFTVKKNEAEITVLGTHFNINAYDDETEMKVTLLEGSVKVTKATKTALLTPGKQAEITKDGEIKVITADVDEVMAWKNSLFSFSKADLPTVMRQLSRWYNVEVSYEGKIADERFGGEMQRTLNLSQVLKLLEKNGVHFSIEANKIIVKP